MERKEAFARLEEMGAGAAYVTYDGGYSEACAQVEEVLDACGERESADAGGLPDLPEDLEDALIAPVYEDLGDIRRAPTDLDGTVTWFVADRRVVIDHSYMDWISEERREI